MSILFYIGIGIVLGVIIGWFLFKWLTKRKLIKLEQNLAKGLENSGIKFLKQESEKEVTDGKENREPRFDREAIIRELIGREKQKDRGIREIEPRTNTKPVDDAVAGDSEQRTEVQGMDGGEHDKDRSRLGKSKNRSKPTRWTNI